MRRPVDRSLMPLNARRYIRKMRGGAQSHLLQADDDRYYVVKFRNNPQHRRILVNELVASRFLRHLQLATPETAIIHVPKEFLEENPEVSYQLGSRTVPVVPGWHFGSCYPGDPNHVAVYDYLPDALLQQVQNLSHFLGVLVADKWMANADGRQSIYFRARVAQWSPASAAHPRRVGFVAQMIDHGFAFNGPHWEFADSPIQGLAPRSTVYASVRSEDSFQPWLDQVTHFPEEAVDQACKQVPPEWLDGDEALLEQLMEKLLRRRKNVAGLLADCRKAKINHFPNWQ